MVQQSTSKNPIMNDLIICRWVWRHFPSGSTHQDFLNLFQYNSIESYILPLCPVRISYPPKYKEWSFCNLPDDEPFLQNIAWTRQCPLFYLPLGSHQWHWLQEYHSFCIASLRKEFSYPEKGIHPGFGERPILHSEHPLTAEFYNYICKCDQFPQYPFPVPSIYTPFLSASSAQWFTILAFSALVPDSSVLTLLLRVMSQRLRCNQNLFRQLPCMRHANFLHIYFQTPPPRSERGKIQFTPWNLVRSYLIKHFVKNSGLFGYEFSICIEWSCKTVVWTVDIHFWMFCPSSCLFILVILSC